jgi:glutathione peroxidase
MWKLAALAALIACSKSEAPSSPPPQPTPVETDPPKMKPTPTTALQAEVPRDTLWNASIHTLEGAATTLASYKGKALLLVNVASECGNTPQYEQLQALQKKYEGRGFTVIGFPCNQFGGQEPGTPKEIHDFATSTYGVTFPLLEKIEVNGAGRHDVYKVLTQLADASGYKGDIRWNFEKFVISADGSTWTRFSPETKPDDPAVVAAIEVALPPKAAMASPTLPQPHVAAFPDKHRQIVDAIGTKGLSKLDGGKVGAAKGVETSVRIGLDAKPVPAPGAQSGMGGAAPSSP